MSKTADFLAHALDGLFDGGAQFVISDGTASGPDGLVGLRLIANCLSVQFGDFEMAADHLEPSVAETTAKPANAGLDDVKKQLTKLAKKKGAWFVVCYQVEGSDEWCMAWSDSVLPSEAHDIMTQYVQSGCLSDW